MLSESQIQRLYKYGTFTTLGISIFVLFYPLLSPNLSERVWPVIIFNMGYHFIFQILSKLPAMMYRLFKEQNSNLSGIGTLMIRTLVVSIIELVIVGGITIIAFNDKTFEMLIILPVLFAVGLGALASWIKMNDLN